MVKTEAAAKAPAEEKSWSASVGFDLWSEYIFRGVAIQDNAPLYSPSASFNWKGLSVWYWGGYGDAVASGEHYEENDYGVDYTLSLFDEKLSLTAGAIMYHYPDGSGTDTYEFYAIASVDVFLTPTVAYYWDFDEIGASYLSLGVSHSFDLGKLVKLEEPKALSLDLTAALGIDFEYKLALPDHRKGHQTANCFAARSSGSQTGTGCGWLIADQHQSNTGQNAR